MGIFFKLNRFSLDISPAIPQVHYVATYCFRKQKIETVGYYQGGALRAPP